MFAGQAGVPSATFCPMVQLGADRAGSWHRHTHRATRHGTLPGPTHLPCTHELSGAPQGSWLEEGRGADSEDKEM